MSTRRERVALRDGAVEALDRSEDQGVGVRVRVGGAWGFAATRQSTPAGAEQALRRALEVAQAASAARGVELAPEPPARGEYAGPCLEDPFAVSLEDKLALLGAADEALRAQPGLAVARAELTALEVRTEFASTEGGLYSQRLTECGAGLVATA
ncbi:MAG: TldD/PmbA family protein, partial [Actinomycetota bacterium]|nr:TldD/PmbA family protein [Actinomycetota bacterium]